MLLTTLRHSTGRAAAVCLLSTGSAAAALALPAALGHTLDLVLTAPHGAGTHHWILGCALLTGLAVLLDAGDGLLTGTTTARSTAWLRHRLLGHTLAAGPEAGLPPAGDLVARLVGNAAQAGAAPTALASLLSAVFLPLGGLIALALIDPWLAAAVLLGLPLLGALLRTFVRDTGDSASRYQRSQGEIAGRLMEALHGLRTISAAGTVPRETDRILEPLPELSRQGYRGWRVQGRSTAQAAALAPLLQIAVLAVAGLRLGSGALSVGSLLAAARYATLATGFGVLVGLLNALVRSRAAAHRLHEVLTAPARLHGTRQPAPGPGTLELRGVCAARAGRTVLHQIDLVVPGGTAVAVVGRSGSGKSTLAALAGRLIDPDRGQVLLDGVPLPELSRPGLRGAIGYAFARPALLGGTLGGTIGLGAEQPPPERVARAARDACAEEFIRLLPDGYATACAQAPLSGGEAQRLGLARAFAHRGRVLVLDDAMSSLDRVTESRVAEALARRAAHRTRLIVAHRAATAARADLVVWLEDGRVRAVAPHARLWHLADYRAVFAPHATAATAGAGAGVRVGEGHG
ncbi:ABC transporter ATP-binding protein [Streptomyces albus subsp. albus]|nr:ABC transporter ATP-binding protein [Streptomyces albus subsp. albus]